VEYILNRYKNKGALKTMSTYQNHIMTEKNIIIIFDDKTVSYPRSHKLFQQVKENLENHNFDAIDFEAEVEKSLKKSSLPENVTIKKGFVKVDGKRLPEVLEKKVIEFYENGLPLYPIVNFYRNLMKNPSEESRKDLFTFLMKNQIPLTEKGMFRAYKKVRDDFTDSHTGTIDNSVGKVVTMPREAVNPNRHVTCSSGLHVASWKYAQGYTGQILLEIQINPQDVVSVPVDYNNAKMRVCKYKVIRVIEQPNENLLEIDPEDSDIDWGCIDESELEE